MKRWMTTGLAILAVTALSAPARAIGPVIDWDPAYFWTSAGTPSFLPPGSVLRGVGTVSQFGPPLAFLNVTMPGTEYTFFIDGLISGGTNPPIGPPLMQIYETPYGGGTIDIYADPTPDATFAPLPPNAAVPATFVDDPPPILTGIFTGFLVRTNNFTTFQTGDMQGNIVWTGGTLFPVLAGGNPEPCPGLFTGGMTWSTAPGIGIPGYMFRHDGKIDLQCPVPARSETWGKIKQLYR